MNEAVAVASELVAIDNRRTIQDLKCPVCGKPTNVVVAKSVAQPTSGEVSRHWLNAVQACDYNGTQQIAWFAGAPMLQNK